MMSMLRRFVLRRESPVRWPCCKDSTKETLEACKRGAMPTSSVLNRASNAAKAKTAPLICG